MEAQISQPDFWNLSQTKRDETINTLKLYKQQIDPVVKILNELEDTETLFILAQEEKDENTMVEVVEQLNLYKEQIDSITLRTTFTDENDGKNIFLNIQAGSGGVDACDWAKILFRMYSRYIAKKKI